MTDEMRQMLAANTYAVVGASRSPEKYGFLVYRSAKSLGKQAYAVNPSTQEVDGDPCYASLADLPVVPEVVVTVVPPAITEGIVDQCTQLGIQQIWMQSGSDSEEAVRRCHAHGISVVSGGPCIMVMLQTWKYSQ